MATIFLWKGNRFKQGNWIDPWGDKNISKTEIRSVGMVIGQKPLLFSETQMWNWLIRLIGGISHIGQIKRECWMWEKK
jgi:hypothetical protein